MLKISTLESDTNAVTLRLEGQIVGPWVEELQKTCEETLTRGQPFRLDLHDVSFVDRKGVDLLASLRSRSVHVINCTPFVREQLKAA